MLLLATVISGFPATCSRADDAAAGLGPDPDLGLVLDDPPGAVVEKLVVAHRPRPVIDIHSL